MLCMYNVSVADVFSYEVGFLLLSIIINCLPPFYLVIRLLFGIYCARLGIVAQNQGVRRKLSDK